MPTFWPYIPSSITETMKFATDVRRARSGEFRDSLHDATQILSYGYTEVGARESTIEQLFRTNISGTWSIPIWHDMTILQSGADYGDTSIAVSSGDYREGGLAVIWSSDGEWEVVNIESYASGVITLPSGEFVTQDYPAGTLVAPVLTAIAPNGLSRDIKIGVTDLTVVFYVTDPTDLAAANYTTHLGFDIVNDSPSVPGNLSGSLSQLLDFIDNGFGSFALVTDETYSRWRGTLEFSDADVEDRWARRQFLHRCRGRDRPFWLPTHKEDLLLNGTHTAGDTTISFQASRIADASALIGRYLFFQNPSGSFAVRQVTNVSGTGPYTLTINSGLSFALPAGSIVNFAHLVRFDADSFELLHRRTADGWFTSVAGVVAEVPE